MKDKEKAYRDKVLGAQFIEFLRRRLILLREILAADGSIYVHLDTKKGHYVKAVTRRGIRRGKFHQRNHLEANYRAKRFSLRWGPIHDTAPFLCKIRKLLWNHVFQAYDERYLSRNMLQ